MLRRGSDEMSSTKTVYILYSILAAICFLILGLSASLFVKSGELGEVESDLRAAITESDRLGERLTYSRARVAELKGLAEGRLTTIGELEEELRVAVGVLQKREKIITGLEETVGGLAGLTGEIGGLATEGRAIVARLLEKDEVE
jgi:hypothetical protein